MKKQFFSVQTMIQIALMLALFIVSKLIMRIIPDLPNGLGDLSNLVQIFIVICSLVFGPLQVLIAVAIFIFGLAWTAPNLFIGGIFYVKGGSAVFGVYMLDYALPLLVLALAGWKIFQKNYWRFLWVITVVVGNYLCHVFSGMIFFGSYAWVGWGVVAFCFFANLFKLASLATLSALLYPLVVFKLAPQFAIEQRNW